MERGIPKEIKQFQLLNEFQLAALLGLGVQTLRNMRCRGEGPQYSKLGSAVRYKLSDALKYCESHKIQTSGEAE